MNHIAAIRTTAPPGLSSQPAGTTAGRAIHLMLTPFSVAYFAAALVTDLADCGWTDHDRFCSGGSRD
jgi:uncharacterized membrane protein